MADQTYVVGISFEVGDIDAKVNSAVSKVASDAKSSFGSLGMDLADAFTGAVERAGALVAMLGAAGAAGAIGAITYGVAGLNSEIEKTKIGLADIFTANGVTSNLTSGLGLASDMMTKIRQDAAALPGETADLARIFKLASIPGLQAGKGVGEIESLSANAMAYGMGVANLDSGTVSRELSMLLSGRAGSHNTLGLQLAGLGGDKAQEFNKKSAGDRFDYLQSEFGKHHGSIDLFGNSFEGQSSSAMDNVKLALTNATNPLFEGVKQTLQKFNTWFGENKSTIDAWSSHFGTMLANAWKRGTEIFQEWLPAIETFASDAFGRLQSIWTKLEPVIASVGGSIKDALSNGEALDKIESILKLYSAVKIGSAIAPYASSGANAIGSMLGGGGGIAAGAASPAMIAGFAAIAGAAVLAAGELSALADTTSKFHKQAVDDASDLSKAWGHLVDDFSGSTGIGGFIQYLGVNATAKVTMFMEGLDSLVHPMAMVHGLLDVWADKLNQLSPKLGTALQEQLDPRLKITNEVPDISRDNDPLASLFRPKAMGGAGLGEIAKAKIPSNAASVHIGTQINHMTVSGNDTPSRVARLAVNMIADKARYPTSSRHIPNYSAGRTVGGG